jgi:hypothetical protein
MTRLVPAGPEKSPPEQAIGRRRIPGPQRLAQVNSRMRTKSGRRQKKRHRPSAEGVPNEMVTGKPYQARLRRRSLWRRVVCDARDSRRSSVDRVASISETVLRIPFRRWAVWNQGLIDFMLKHSPIARCGCSNTFRSHVNPALIRKKELIGQREPLLGEARPNLRVLQTLRPAVTKASIIPIRPAGRVAATKTWQRAPVFPIDANRAIGCR